MANWNEKQIALFKEAQSWEVEYLIAFIIRYYHDFVYNETPKVLEYSKRFLAETDPDKHKETKEAIELFAAMITALDCHLMQEEKSLFPALNAISKAKTEGVKPSEEVMSVVEVLVKNMDRDHIAIVEAVEKLKKYITDQEKYRLIDKSMRIAFAQFIENVEEHTYMEDEILFKKALLFGQV